MIWLINLKSYFTKDHRPGDTAAPSVSQAETIPPAPISAKLPIFEYYPNPIENGSIEKKTSICQCCETEREFTYTGPIYSTQPYYEVCPWCVYSGRAHQIWGAIFQDINASGPIRKQPIDPKIYAIITERTPGYTSWQGNNWLFSETDAMVFLGEVDGQQLLSENDTGKIDAVLDALNRIDSWTVEQLSDLVCGGEPAVYLFQDRADGSYHAYQDFG